ncbi:MAG: thiamine phosphate synthase [Geodermatophilaceae bacterium]|nr:thiamine phosphate synthase [Geodermatophilaceae bacterium]
MRPPLDLSVYLVTDTRMCGRFGVVPTVIDAVSAGVTAVQLRDPQSSDEEFVALGTQLRKSLDGTGVPLLVNDRVHLAAEMGASGAHVGQGDVHPLSARDVLGADAYLGLSVQTVDHVDKALQLPAGTLDYLGVGPVWRQSTKPDAGEPCSPEALAHIVRRSPWPCVAIGGVDAARAATVRRAGAAGMAVVSAICGRSDAAAATRNLRDAWERS